MTEPNTHEMTTEQPRGGGQPGNRNAIRHGMRGAGLPRGCERIGRECNKLRRTLEDAVAEARGEVSLVDAAFINTAYRCERHAQLAQKWLANEAHNMTPADRLSYSREVARASESRDKAIAALKLPERPTVDPWGTLTIPAGNVSVSDADASDGQQEPHT